MPLKHKMTIYLTEEEKKALEDWAASENRAVSNLAVTIIIKALEERQEQLKSGDEVGDAEEGTPRSDRGNETES